MVMEAILTGVHFSNVMSFLKLLARGCRMYLSTRRYIYSRRPTVHILIYPILKYAEFAHCLKSIRMAVPSKIDVWMPPVNSGGGKTIKKVRQIGHYPSGLKLYVQITNFSNARNSRYTFVLPTDYEGPCKGVPIH
jgi:hypothetical protein